MEGRPRLIDFESRVGQAFRVFPAGGGDSSEWILEACSGLPIPSLPDLEGQDCFELIFKCPPGYTQGLYEFSTDDGCRATLFAVPHRSDGMVVTVN